MQQINIKNIFTWLILALFAYAMTILCINKLLAYAELNILSGALRMQILFYLLASIYVALFYHQNENSIPEKLALVFSCVSLFHGLLTSSISIGSCIGAIMMIFSLPLSLMLGKTLIRENTSTIEC